MDKAGEHLSSDILKIKSNLGELWFIQSFLNQRVSEWVEQSAHTGNSGSQKLPETKHQGIVQGRVS